MKKEKKSGFFSFFRKKENVQTQQNDDASSTEENVKNDDIVASSTDHEPIIKETSVINVVETVSEIKTPSAESPLNTHESNDNALENVTEIQIENVPAQPNHEVLTEETEPKSAPETESIQQENVIPAPEIKEKSGFFSQLKKSLFKTKQSIGSSFFSFFKNKKIDDDLFEELEEKLLIADVGIETSTKLIATLTARAKRDQLKNADALYHILKEEMAAILASTNAPLDVKAHSPFVILMVGVNGVGKTTTIGKLAKQFQSQGHSVMLAAGDTFRAAAVEQLQVWGERNHIPVIAQQTGADAASVIYDALQAAKAKKIDILIADTAGRLQNKNSLMDELKKIVRVMKKHDENTPHEIMLTLDASTGQNAISQVKLFNEATTLTGITLTKMDGTAKGGVIFALADQFKIPIRYIGVGEKIDDLRPFNAEDFINALFDLEE